MKSIDKESQGQNAPENACVPKSDVDVDRLVHQTLMCEADYISLVNEIFLQLLPTVYTKDVLASDPTGHTRERLLQLRRHAEQIAETMALSLGELKSSYGVIRGRCARKIKFFS